MTRSPDALTRDAERLIKAIDECGDDASQDDLARHAGFTRRDVPAVRAVCLRLGWIGVDATHTPHRYRLSPEAHARIAARWPRHERAPLRLLGTTNGPVRPTTS